MAIYVHIGMPKTGTTFLQEALQKNSHRLRELGIVYPNPMAALGAGTETAHHFLAHALAGKRLRHTPAANFSLLPRHVETLKREILDGGGIGLISSEDFAALRPKGIQKLRQLFEEDTKIVVYLRRQDAWADSLYGQTLKVGRNITVEKMIENERWRLNYAGFLANWSAAFGAGNIIVRCYERMQGNDLWSDLFTALGEPDAAAIEPAIDSANESLPLELTMYLRALNIYGYQQELRLILEGLSSHFPNRPGLKYLSLDQAHDFLDRYAQSNRTVAETYLGRSVLFADTEPQMLVERQELTTTQVIQIFGGITLHLLDRIRTLENQRRWLSKETALQLLNKVAVPEGRMPWLPSGTTRRLVDTIKKVRRRT